MFHIGTLLLSAILVLASQIMKKLLTEIENV